MNSKAEFRALIDHLHEWTTVHKTPAMIISRDHVTDNFKAILLAVVLRASLNGLMNLPNFLVWRPVTTNYA